MVDVLGIEPSRPKGTGVTALAEAITVYTSS